MHGTLSSDDQASSDAADDWIGVFQPRGVWPLTREIVDRWVARNSVLFDTLDQLTPPGSQVLELGCGPGRHTLGAATRGYRVAGIDRDRNIIAQAAANARSVAPRGTFHTITQGGVMEHLDSAQRIREALFTQLAYASTVVFGVPVKSAKNRMLFQKDDIFRQLRTPEEWTHNVLAGLPIADASSDLHPEENMTDDLVVALRA